MKTNFKYINPKNILGKTNLLMLEIAYQLSVANQLKAVELSTKTDDADISKTIAKLSEGFGDLE